MALTIVAMSSYMNTLDTSIVNISLPRLSETFGVSASAVLWVVLAYMLTLTGLMLTVGRLADTLGRNRLFTVGIAVATLGLGLCALAQNLSQLVLFRVIQASGAAAVVALGIAIITEVFPEKERGRALGITIAVVGAGLTSGPVLGGLLLEVFDWRAIFYLRLPVGMLTLFMAYAFLKRQPSPGLRGGRFDWGGAFTLFLGLGAFLRAINQGQARGWLSPFILGLAIGAAFSLGLFLFVESRVSRPVLDIRMFHHRVFAAGTSSLFLTFIVRMSINVLTPFYLIQSLDFSPSLSGLLMGTIPLSLLLLSPVSGWLSDRLGARSLCITGMGVVVLGVLLMLGLDDTSTAADVAITLTLFGVGCAIFEPPNMNLIMGASSKERLGTASAIVSTLRTVGQSVGLALAGAVFATRQQTYSAGGMAKGQALAGGFHDALLVSLPVGVVVIVLCLLGGKQEHRRATVGA